MWGFAVDVNFFMQFTIRNGEWGTKSTGNNIQNQISLINYNLFKHAGMRNGII